MQMMDMASKAAILKEWKAEGCPEPTNDNCYGIGLATGGFGALRVKSVIQSYQTAIDAELVEQETKEEAKETPDAAEYGKDA